MLELLALKLQNHWTNRNQLDNAYLEPLNPHAAANLLRALVLAGDSLVLFPNHGRLGLAAGTRELVAVSPYLVVYEVYQAALIGRILPVWHSARRFFGLQSYK
jgi:plasmid stabilization system protein ParE